MAISTEYSYKSGSYLKLFGVCLVGALFIAAVAAYDYYGSGMAPLAEASPHLERQNLLRSAVMLCFAALFAIVVRASGRLTAAERLDGFSVLAVYASAIGSLVAALVFLYYPIVFHRYSREDGLIEWGSAAACFLATVTFLYCAYRCRARGRGWSALICVGLAGLLFLVGMEEISWMQRIWGFQSTELFAGNSQNEVNLHNFNTSYSENIYYFGSFLILIAVPFLNEAYGIAVGDHPLADAMPDRAVALAAAPLVAFNYDMWHVVFTQIAFFVTLALLVAYLYDMRHRRYGQLHVVLAAILSVVVVQAIFLVFGGNLVRPWEPTEYKELIIPAAFCFYAFRVAIRTFSR